MKQSHSSGSNLMGDGYGYGYGFVDIGSGQRSSVRGEEGPRMIIDRQNSGHWGRNHKRSLTPTPPNGDAHVNDDDEEAVNGGVDRGGVDEATPMLLAPGQRSSQSLLSSSQSSSSPLIGRGLVVPLAGESKGMGTYNYGTYFDSERGKQRSIRFQVVVWYVGPVDVVLGRVTMKFRLTIFWNDVEPDDHDDDSVKPSYTWTMDGRRKAYQKEVHDPTVTKAVDVPPVSILNAVSFDVVGSPEVSQLNDDTKLMRWTCLYKAIVIQDDIRVDQFPHDEHDLVLRMGILVQRRSGGRWDRHKWRLALATRSDSQDSTRVPHGLIVDHVKIPEFSFVDGLNFQFGPLSYGAEQQEKSKDTCLEVRLKVIRNSGYYDKNIMPLLAVLNLVAISALALDATEFFKRGLLILNISFTEIGLRMTVDNHLPNVGYQIKMQRILNQYFFVLLYLVIESGALYFCITRRGLDVEVADWIDVFVACSVLAHSIVLVTGYYRDMRRVQKKLLG